MEVSNFDALKKLAEEVVWYECDEKYIQTETSYKHFLVFLLSRGTDEDISYARNTLQIPDADFIDALKSAKPGVFIYEAKWDYWNKKFNIIPKLPFPVKWPERFCNNTTTEKNEV